APAGDRARAGLRVEITVPREHVARVPDAAQRDARIYVDAAPGRRRADRGAGEAPARSHRVERAPPADDHQRDSRHLAHRSGADAAADVDVPHSAADKSIEV